MESIKNIWADGRSRMVLAFVGIVLALAISYVVFGGSRDAATQSSVRAVPSHGDARTEAPSPAYVKAVGSADQRRIDAAQSSGASAFPTIISAAQTPPPTEIVRPSGSSEPTSGVRGLPTRTDNGVQQAAIAQVNQEQVEAVKARMKALLAARTVEQPVTAVIYTEPKTSAEDVAAQTSSSSSSSAADHTTKDSPSKLSLPLAGTVVYAETISTANSDSPGPVIARVLQGPYTGAIVVGSFEKGRDSLSIKFSKMSVATTSDGTEVNGSVGINAVAVDTKYIGTGLATDVDHHYAEKIATAFTTSFLQGMGQAISNSGSTSVNSYGSTTTQNATLSGTEKALVATGTAAGAVGQILQQEYGSRPTTITVEAGTPIGLLFL